MKEFNIVYLKHDEQYTEFGIKKDYIGITIGSSGEKLKTIFFNPHIAEDFVIVSVDKNDVVFEKESFPKEIENEILNNLDIIYKKANTKLKKQSFKEYDDVELLVEDEKYSKHGIHKGAFGTVIEDYVINNSVLVDFSWVDKDFNYYGDIIDTNISDIRKVEK